MIRFLFFLIALLLGLFFNSFAQSKKELEIKKKKLQRDIKLTKNLLEENKQDKKESLNKLVKLNKQIDGHKQVITTINTEVAIIDDDITKKKQEVTILLNNLILLKNEYALMLQFAQKNKSVYDKMLFIFSSQDFNKAYNRIKYLQEFTAYRKKQGLKIMQEQSLLKEKVSEMLVVKGEKVNLVEEQKHEVKQLGGVKKEQEKTIVQLSQREKELKQQLLKKQEDAQRLQQAIQRIIEEEIRKARELALKEETKKAVAFASKEKARKEILAKNKKLNKKNPNEVIKPVASGNITKSNGMILTPDAQILSNSFESNKGRLPWPVTEGVVSGSYGVHFHPVLKNVQTKNDGINISTRKGANVRVIFDGEVTGVVSIPNAGKAIIVRHGEYLSVYTNLEEVFVKKGDKIKTKQNIGTLSVDENNKSEIQLQIWKGSSTQNPQFWITS